MTFRTYAVQPVLRPGEERRTEACRGVRFACRGLDDHASDRLVSTPIRPAALAVIVQ